MKGAMLIAIYHFHVKMVSRGKGKSAVGKAAYISGEKIKNEYDNMTHDYRKKKEIVHKEILLPDNAPQKFKKRSVLWNAVEKSETRKNSQTARNIDAALPVELSRAEQVDLVRNFCNQCFVSSGMCVDFAIHDKNDGNPHVHILLTTRRVDENGFTTKDRSWNDRDLLKLWRERWADWCNHKLHSVSDERIDHRSYVEQGIEKVPQLHLGAAACAIEKKGYRTDKGSRNRKIQLANTDAEIERIKSLLTDIRNGRNTMIKETIESELNCSLFETATAESKDFSDWEQFKKLAKGNGIQLSVVDKAKGGQVAYFSKHDTEKLTAVLQQLSEKENKPVIAHTSEPDKPKKKPHSR